MALAFCTNDPRLPVVTDLKTQLQRMHAQQMLQSAVYPRASASVAAVVGSLPDRSTNHPPLPCRLSGSA